MSATIVTFAEGMMTGASVVVHAENRPDGAIVIVDATPFHPVDHTWPDQPGDSGTVGVDAERVDVVEALMVAENDEGNLAVGSEIPVKRGAEGWTWLVGHRLAAPEVPGWLTVGSEVRLDVDAGRRAALSRGHTACHLASLALDLALADLWRKEPGLDAMGNPDFEGRANQSSGIREDGSVDEYRLGKSLRKAGFDTETFVATISAREERINAQLAEWVMSGARSWVATDGPLITDRRHWHCGLPQAEAVILCGGTHVDSLTEFAGIRVSLDLSDPQLLVMTTTVQSTS